MFVSLSSNPFYRLPGEKSFYPESRRHFPKVAQIECDQDVCPAIHHRLQNHLIVWIVELGSPQKMCWHWLSHRNHCIDKNIHLSYGERRREPMLPFMTNSIVF